MATREKELKEHEVRTTEVLRPKRAKVTPEQTEERMASFASTRKDKFIASVRKNKG